MNAPDLRQLVAATAPEDLPELGGRLREAELLVEVRLRTAPMSGNGHGPEREAEVWITPQQAAKIASIEVRTLYDWAANKPWASRKTKRCLRIDERGFRRWLSARTR